MGKILALTGLTGKSGGVFAERISDNINSVNDMFPDGIRILVRESSCTTKLDTLLPQAEKCKGDLADIDFLYKCFKDIDTIFHVAGVHWSREVAKAAVNSGVRRIIMVHTSGIYSKYKTAGEEYRQIDAYVTDICKKNNIKITILRPTMIYGNSNDKNIITFIKMVDKFIIMPVVNDAMYELQPVHYSDLGSAYYQVLMNEETVIDKEFILSGGAPILLKDMLKIIGNNLNKKVYFFSCPLWLAYSGAWIVYLLSLRKMDFREKVQRLCESRAYSHQEATKAFGYNPMNFEEGIIQEVKDYQGR